MRLNRHVAIVGSREYASPKQLYEIVGAELKFDDVIISGGAESEKRCPVCRQGLPTRSADYMAYKYAKAKGFDLMTYFPKYAQYGKPATFIRNKVIAENSDLVLAFYRKGHFQSGGTANTAEWARKLGIELKEFEEE
jgi:predicted Rossmann fold nucleotide-binding protein DprA/Smf involved in DNA uptake